MNTFTYEYPIKVYFGEKAAANNLPAELCKVGSNVLLACGGGSIKRAGIYDEMIWAAAMAENGILKIGKVTDFQAHMIEHQVGAYTSCNHGMGLAVIHPALYRHLYKAAPWKFTKLATSVFGVDEKDKTEEEVALEGIEALESYIKEIGMPTRFSEMGITDEEVLRKAADTCILTGGCARELPRDEIYELLKEAL